MPGPLSNPRQWDENKKAPRVPRQPGDSSGKTHYDHESGKWTRRLMNRIGRNNARKGSR